MIRRLRPSRLSALAVAAVALASAPTVASADPASPPPGPTVTLASPADGAVVGRQVIVRGTAQSPNGIEAVAVGAVIVDVAADGSFSRTVELPVGAATIVVIVKDRSGLLAVARRTLQVSASPETTPQPQPQQEPQPDPRPVVITDPTPPPPPRCIVPRLVGRTLVQARAALRQAGCKAGRVTRVRRAGKRANVVVAQSVGAGRTVALGTAVALRARR